VHLWPPKNTQGTALSDCTFGVSPDLRPPPKPHQGTIFLRPFFFLLVDSFLVSPFDPFCFPSGPAASVLDASPDWSVVADATSVFASVGWPAVPVVAPLLGVVSVVPDPVVPLAEFSVVVGEF